MKRKKIPKGCFKRNGKVICPKKKAIKASSRNKTINNGVYKLTKVSAVC